MAIATVLGGTGFLGRHVVDRLLMHGIAVRVASRHPRRNASAGAGANGTRATPVLADIHDDASVAAAVQGADGVVNAVSLYVEKGSATFRSVHVEAAARVAKLAREAGVRRLVHVSGIGANARSSSPYIRSRGEGEAAVRAAFPDAVIVRPAVMFGPEDAFLVPLAEMLRRFPAFPLFGSGRTRLQPAYVEDVAEAIARCITAEEAEPRYELGGPQVYTYRSLIETVCRRLGRNPVLLPVPFGLWHPLAHAAEALPRPPITRNQVDLMTLDNIAAAGAPGFEALGMTPTPVEEVLDRILS